MNKNSKLIASLLAVISLSGLGQTPTWADGTPQSGYVMINIQPDGKTTAYKALLDGTDVYMTVDDVALITDQTVIKSTVGELSVAASVKASLKMNSDEPVWFLSRNGAMSSKSRMMVFREYVFMDSGAYQVPVIADTDGTPYYGLASMLYYLHAQWQTIDGQLVVYPCGLTIFDFADQYFVGMHDASVSQADLLMNGESSIGHAIRTVLANIYKDFDPRLYNPFGGANSAMIEDYKNALLRLTYLDSSFVEEAGQQHISELLGQSAFNDIKVNWDHLTALDDAISNVNKSANFFTNVSSVFHGDGWVKFDPKGDISVLDEMGYGKLKDTMKYASTALDVIEVSYNTANVYMRSQQWSNDFLSELAILNSINPKTYYSGAKVKNAAMQLIAEKADPLRAATREGLWGYFGILAEYPAPYNPVAALKGTVDAIMAALETDSTLAVAVADASDMVYTSDLIDIEQIAWNETYSFLTQANLIATPVSPGDYVGLKESFAQLQRQIGGGVPAHVSETAQTSAISNLRMTLSLTLNSMLRNQISIYKYHSDLDNSSPSWARTAEARKMQNDIYQTYAWIVQLQNTRDYDKLLPTTDGTNAIISDINGLMRTPLLASIFQQGDIPTISAQDQGLVDVLQQGIWADNGGLAGVRFVGDGTWAGKWFDDNGSLLPVTGSYSIQNGTLTLIFDDSRVGSQIDLQYVDYDSTWASVVPWDDFNIYAPTGQQVFFQTTWQPGGAGYNPSEAPYYLYRADLLFSDTTGRVDLTPYLGTDIALAALSIPDMKDTSAVGGPTEYTNGTVSLRADYGSTTISEISIDGECRYSLGGIHVGMDLDAAIQALADSGWEQSSVSGTGYSNDGNMFLSFGTDRGSVVSNVSVTMF